jgi:DNA polymerase-3 subunit beta
MLTANVTTIAFQQSEIHAALSRVRHAICKEQTRYYLNGVYMHATREGVHFVATDGHRLARVTIPTSDDYSLSLSPVILPTDFVAAAIKATSKRSQGNRLATMQIEPGTIRFCPADAKTVDDTIEATPIDGTFPDYLRVVPSGSPKYGVISIPAEQFGQAVNAVTDYCTSNARDARNGAIVRLAFGANSVTVSGTPCETRPAIGKSPEFSEARATVHDIGIQGCVVGNVPDGWDAPNVAFNGRYLAELVKAVDSSTVLEFHYFDPSKPALLRAYGDQLAYFVLMPCRI